MTAIGWDRLPDLYVGDIVHVYSQSLLGDVIRWAEQKHREQPSWSSHTAMIFRQGSYLPDVIEAFTRVRVRPLDAYRFEPSHLLVHRHPQVTQDSQRLLLRSQAEKLRGKGYGYGDLLAHFGDSLINKWFDTDIRFIRSMTFRPHQPICSWLVAEAYEKGLNLTLGKDARFIQPDDILDYCVAQDWPLIWTSDQVGLDRYDKIYNTNWPLTWPTETT